MPVNAQGAGNTRDTPASWAARLMITGLSEKFDAFWTASEASPPRTVTSTTYPNNLNRLVNSGSR